MNMHGSQPITKDETQIVNNMLSIQSAPSKGLSPDCRLKISDIRWIRIPNFLIPFLVNEDQVIYMNNHGVWWGRPKDFRGFDNETLNLLIREGASVSTH